MPSRGYERAISKRLEATTLKAKMDAARKSQNTDIAPHLIVQALAGTGKSTTILLGTVKLCGGDPTRLPGREEPIVPSKQQEAVWDAIYQSRGAKSIHLGAFNSSIAEHLSESLKTFGLPSYVTASTMHSMGLRAITSTYGRDIKVCQPKDKKVSDIVENLMSGTYKDIWDIRRRRPGLVPLIIQLVGLCKGNLLEGTEADCYGLLAHHSMNPGEDATIIPEAIRLVPGILEECCDLSNNPSIDFNDMIWIPLKNKLVIKQYDLFLGDEVQDWNRAQQELAKKAGRRLVLVGDSHQAIYGFAGADSQSMKRMQQELEGKTYEDSVPGQSIAIMSKDRGCVVLPLTVTRRCGKAIVEEARKIVPDFEAHESNGPGKISRASIEQIQFTTKLACNPYYRDLAQDGDMVLCRLNAPLVSECFKFLKSGQRANIQGRDIGQGLISTVKGTKAETVTELIHSLGKWISDQTVKENAKKHPSQDKLLALNDRYDCLMCFVEGQGSVQGVLDKIASIFSDDKTTGVKLSSIHRAKGLEAERVFVLETEKTRRMMEMSKERGGWQYEQEKNLRYVAVTRAISELVFVS